MIFEYEIDSYKYVFDFISDIQLNNMWITCIDYTTSSISKNSFRIENSKIIWDKISGTQFDFFSQKVYPWTILPEAINFIDRLMHLKVYW